MKTNKQTNKTRLIFGLLIAVVFFGAVRLNVKAQDTAIKNFKVGDRVEANLADLANNSPDNWQKGTIKEIYYSEGRIFSYLVSVDSLGYAMQFKNYARLIRPSQAADNGGKTTDNNRDETLPDSTTPTKDESNADDVISSGDCSFAAQPEVKPTAKFSQSLIKSVLYERYSFEANTGGLSSPEKIGVTFLNIQIGNSYTNTVSVVPGRGAQRKQDGAPPNATIYPFKAKYIVCKKYSKETTRTQFESDFICFKDRTGNWNCPVDSVPKITYLK